MEPTHRKPTLTKIPVYEVHGAAKLGEGLF